MTTPLELTEKLKEIVKRMSEGEEFIISDVEAQDEIAQDEIANMKGDNE